MARERSVQDLPSVQESTADPARLGPGDRLSRISQLVVKNVKTVTSDDGEETIKFHVENAEGFGYWVDASIVESEMYAADHAKSGTQKVSQTVAALRLMSARESVFKVCFNKVDGSERILRGKYVSNDSVFGSSRVIDLDLLNPPNNPEAACIRQVKHDRIKWLILRGVRYEVR